MKCRASWAIYEDITSHERIIGTKPFVHWTNSEFIKTRFKFIKFHLLSLLVASSPAMIDILEAATYYNLETK